MNRVKVELWGRKFNLPVSYSCYPGEEITEMQKDTLQEFCEKEKPLEGTLGELKKYVLASAEDNITDEKIENIFKYVMPKCLYLPRAEEQVIAVICNYRFDIEHGLAVVIEAGKLKEIGTEDIIL